MSFSSEHRTLRSGKTYSQRLYPKSSATTENTIDASETGGFERINGSTNRISPQLIKERIRANLEPPYDRIATVARLLNQIIRDHSVKTTAMAGPQIYRLQAGSSFDSKAGVSSTAIGGTELSPDIRSWGWRRTLVVFRLAIRLFKNLEFHYAEEIMMTLIFQLYFLFSSNQKSQHRGILL